MHLNRYLHAVELEIHIKIKRVNFIKNKVK
jgi:hypothetical protein